MDSRHAPWHLVRSDDKRCARRNAISHVLASIPYKKVPHAKVKLQLAQHRASAPGSADPRPAPARAGLVIIKEDDPGSRRVEWEDALIAVSSTR